MSFTESVTICLTKKYADFNGRASRSEYWWFFAFYMGILTILFTLAWVTFSASVAASRYGEPSGFSALLFVLFFIVFLAGIVPFLAAGARRLHDTGKPATYLLFYLLGGLAGIGGIVLIILCAMEPNRGPNVYGPDPLGPAGQAAGLPNPYAQPYGSTQPYAQPQAQQFGGAPTAQPAGNPYAQPYGYGSAPADAQPTGNPYAQPYGSAPAGAQPTSGPYTAPASNQPPAQPTGNPYAAPAQPYGSAPADAQPTGNPYAAPESQPSPAATDQPCQDQTGSTAPEGDGNGNGATGNGTV